MFEDVPAENLPAVLVGVEHDFEEDLGASRVDAITGWERVNRKGSGGLGTLRRCLRTIEDGADSDGKRRNQDGQEHQEDDRA